MNNDIQKTADVVVVKSKGLYPAYSPFDPDTMFPEYIFDEKNVSKTSNDTYTSLREALFLCGLDSENFNKKSWNPFSNIIVPGQTVIIKPNAVLHKNLKNNESTFASITHGSILRAVIDYVYIAQKGQGRIIVADAPLSSSDFFLWKKETGIQDTIDLYKNKLNYVIELYDLRHMYAPWDEKNGFTPSDKKTRLDRDPRGYREINLKNESEFAAWDDHQASLLFGADYDRKITIENHSHGNHKYKISQTFLDADTIISIPKLKVHSKVGVTLNIKSMVGTQGDKNYIPHCRIGNPKRGGDEYPDLGYFQNFINRYRMWTINNILSKEKNWADLFYRFILRPIQNRMQGLAHRVGKFFKGDKYIGNIIGGAWYGNDTAWRMSLDLMKSVLYCDKEGNMTNIQQRNFFCIVDGIIGGEDEGPLSPTTKESRVLIVGSNPLFVDSISSLLIGFDPEKMRTFQTGFTRSWLSHNRTMSSIKIDSNIVQWKTLSDIKSNNLHFRPSKGWRNNIKYDAN